MPTATEQIDDERRRAETAIQMCLEQPVEGNYTYCGDHAFPQDARGIHGRFKQTGTGTTAEITHVDSGRRFRVPADWNGRVPPHPCLLTELAPL